VQLALIGYVPELGKQSSATIGLCRNGAIEVGIQTDQGNITRSWKKGKTVKAEVSSTGNILETPAVLMDSREYFNLGPKDQVRYVFARCNIEREFSAEKITAAIKNIRLTENTEQTEAAIGQVLSLVEDTDYLRRDHDESVQTWLEDLTAQIRDRLKTTRANAEAMTSLVKGMTGLQASEDGPAVSDVSGKITDIRGKIVAATGKMSQLRKTISDQEQIATKRREWQSTLSGTSFKDLEGRKAEATAAVKELAAKVANYQSQTTDLAVLEARVRSEQGQEQGQLDRIGREMKADQARTETLLSKPCCPTCGTEGKAWKGHLEQELTTRQAERKQSIQEGQARLARYAQQLQSLSVQLQPSRQADAQHQSERQSLRAAERQLQDIDSLIAQRNGIVNALAALGEPVDVTAVRAQAEQLEREIVFLQAELTQLDRRQKAWNQAQQDAKRSAQAQIQAKELAAQIEVYRESVALLEKMQVEIVAKAFGAILADANRIVASVVPWRIECRDGVLGRFEGPTWIGHQVFSGLEKAIAYAGISVALSQDAPIRIVMIDEVLIDTDSRKALLSAMLRLTAQKALDQFILVDVDEVYVPEGVNVIRV
jgi:DNA repair exonuclease SbcCD ATPase subunit